MMSCNFEIRAKSYTGRANFSYIMCVVGTLLRYLNSMPRRSGKARIAEWLYNILSFAKMENFHIDLDLVSSIEEFDLDELENLVELSDDPISDEQIELYIYLCIHIHQKWHKEEFLKRATRRAKEWEAMESTSHVHHERRCDILSVVLAQGQQQQQQQQDDTTKIEETHAIKPR